MKASRKVSAGVLAARFLRAIEVWCAWKQLSTGAFGAAVYRDRGFVASLRDGRCPRLRTVDRALAAMGEPPAGPAFRREVETFLAVTRIKRSLLGQEATGNPSFVGHLLGDVSPTLATVEAVRASMKSHASPAERREIRARSGVLPAILTDDPLPPPKPPARLEDEEPDRPTYEGWDWRFMDTREAAARLRLAPSTLERYRTTGEGPLFHRFGGCVRYREDHLDEWEAERKGARRTSR